MADQDYTCKECGRPVVIKDEKIIRICPHKDAPVIASMTAVATGEGTTEQK